MFDTTIGELTRGLVMAACVLPLLAACGRDPAPAGAEAVRAPARAAAQPPGPGDGPAVVAPATGIDLAACLRAAQGEGDAPCPGFIVQELPALIDTCSGVGGTLLPGPAPAIWRLDVDRDGTDELMIEFGENFYCEGAASLFSCGSLGCPYVLYARRDAGWSTLGAINAMDAHGLEVLGESDAGHARLRGGCSGERPCDEYTYYTWDGSAYQRAYIEVRGSTVDVAPGGLWTLTADTEVLAGPAADAGVIERYPAGTEVVVIGNARGADWRYVSPCNACESGFVPTGVLRK